MGSSEIPDVTLEVLAADKAVKITPCSGFLRCKRYGLYLQTVKDKPELDNGQ